MKKFKFALATLAIVATLGSAFTAKKTNYYWFRASDDASIGASVHFSSSAQIIDYLENNVSGLNFNDNGTGSLYAEGYVQDNTNFDPEALIHSTPQ